MSICSINLETLNDLADYLQDVFYEAEANEIENVVIREINKLKGKFTGSNADINALAQVIIDSADVWNLVSSNPRVFDFETIKAQLSHVASGNELAEKNIVDQLVDSQDAADRRKVNGSKDSKNKPKRS